ncbi:sorting nexin-16-like [Actinia tenebrosa]|uniref:Sorting nexin-16-like n=1 Tax=Actinia tenebrosa TaxID=6105 RepID=A0A6P8HTM7_ACTTE|nr:sorting nexin-16-like [Actinia tenebrosa]
MSNEGEVETAIGIRAPIVGYEVVDRREKFTVYKVHVKDRDRTWFVFRRYTDFVRLNERLENAFRGFHFTLPSKRWLKNNFDPEFIEERARGLQFFLDNVMHHTTISRSDIVKQFLCLDDPPGPYDSLEESRAYCQHLEDEIENLKEQLREAASELSATRSQLAQARVQQEALVSSLKEERATNSYRKSLTQETSKDSFKPIMDGHRIISRKRSSDLKKSDNIQETESTATKSSWATDLEIAAHSKGVDKIKPTPRRTPAAMQPLTSTPTKDSDLVSFTDSNISREGSSEEASGIDAGKDIKKDNEATASNQCDESDDKEVTENDISESRPSSEHSNKRDSGIILDSPQPPK